MGFGVRKKKNKMSKKIVFLWRTHVLKKCWLGMWISIYLRSNRNEKYI